MKEEENSVDRSENNEGQLEESKELKELAERFKISEILAKEEKEIEGLGDSTEALIPNEDEVCEFVEGKQIDEIEPIEGMNEPIEDEPQQINDEMQSGQDKIEDQQTT